MIRKKIRNFVVLGALKEAFEKATRDGKCDHRQMVNILDTMPAIKSLSQWVPRFTRVKKPVHLHARKSGELAEAEGLPAAGAAAETPITLEELEEFKKNIMKKTGDDSWINDPNDPPPRMEPDMGGGESFWVTICYQEGQSTGNQEYIEMANILVECTVQAFEELVGMIIPAILQQLNNLKFEESAEHLEEEIAEHLLQQISVSSKDSDFDPVRFEELLLEVIINSPMLLDGYRFYSGDVPYTRLKCLRYIKILAKVASLAALVGLNSLAEAVGMSPLSLAGIIAEEDFNLARETGNRLYLVLGEALLIRAERYYNGEYYQSTTDYWPYELGLFLKAAASAFELTEYRFYKERARSSFDALDRLSWYEPGDDVNSGAYTVGNSVVFSHLNVTSHALVHWASLDQERKDHYLGKVRQMFEYDRGYLYTGDTELIMHDCSKDGSGLSPKWCACCDSYFVEIVNAYKEVV